MQNKKQKYITFKLPEGWQCKKTGGETIYGEDVKFMADKIRISAKLFNQLFTEPKQLFLKEVFDRYSHLGISVLFLVGSCVHRTETTSTLQKSLPGCQIIIPDDPGVAIIQGAVMYGSNFICSLKNKH